MAKKSSSNSNETADAPINKEVVAIDLAIMSNIIGMLSQMIGLFSLVLQAEVIQEDEKEEAMLSANRGSNSSRPNSEISPERFKKLEKQVMYLSKEMERLKK
ncbi:hypothetical protein [Lysinibacillus odysseyi]|uniref:Uncharacterized protein n=1 Tax=Lysinibacillus odysseyi 34hs-1 = NBRC 100172 TaxID=1220589 RepID=A0A0A3IGB0_9BACI|nr:hypothetical protein [Lysinibacillus odysseyi]KGR81848.1 hypothetical protein CD32_21230 [Lysinibacillus odysseyi 34hs-1 = NBRC 100172]